MNAPPAIVERIKKLLRLSRDPANVHEAASAAARAQALLLQYRLTQAAVEATASPGTLFELRRPATPERWRRHLGSLVCREHGCAFLVSEHATAFVGPEEDVQVAAYLFVYLSRVLARLSRQGWAAHVEALTDSMLGRYPSLDEPDAESLWRDSFCFGAVEAIAVRLRREAHVTEGTALMRVRDGLVARHDAILDGLAQVGRVRPLQPEEILVHPHGFDRGVRAGRSVPLRPALPRGEGAS